MVVVHIDVGTGEHQEEALFTLGTIADQAGADIRFVIVEEQPKVVRGDRILGLVRDDGVPVVGPLHVHIVGGAVDALDLGRALNGDPYGEILHRRKDCQLCRQNTQSEFQWW